MKIWSELRKKETNVKMNKERGYLEGFPKLHSKIYLTNRNVEVDADKISKL